MSIAKRKELEKIEMRKRILDGARKIFLEKGYDQTSIRNIASEINYSPGSIYFYFKEKTEIFHELHKEGFRLLLSQMKELDVIEDPYERYKEMGLVFIRFAQQHTDYYNLMFLVSETGKSEGEGFQIAQGTIEYLSDVIDQCQQRGKFKDLDNKFFTLLTISSVHGICSLYCKDRMKGFFEKSSEELMIHGYECFIALTDKY
nr:TetR/AcrR family transcriptional regulator [uncultured Dyadobacter sp.]